MTILEELLGEGLCKNAWMESYMQVGGSAEEFTKAFNELRKSGNVVFFRRDRVWKNAEDVKALAIAVKSAVLADAPKIIKQKDSKLFNSFDNCLKFIHSDFSVTNEKMTSRFEKLVGDIKVSYLASYSHVELLDVNKRFDKALFYAIIKNFTGWRGQVSFTNPGKVPEDLCHRPVTENFRTFKNVWRLTHAKSLSMGKLRLEVQPDWTFKIFTNDSVELGEYAFQPEDGNMPLGYNAQKANMPRLWLNPELFQIRSDITWTSRYWTFINYIRKEVLR